MTDKVKEIAPTVWEAIQKANNILMHNHPGPDPDTVGSSLAMMHMLKGMGKKATVIRGDSESSVAMSYLPGYDQIVPKNYLQINPSEYDLFIIMDSSAPDMISKLGQVTFPETMNTIIIDHHISNQGYAKVNLVDENYIATCQIIFDLMKLWGVTITPEIAACLFLGIYTDSGGFKYAPTNSETFIAASELVKIYPDFSKLLFNFDNSNEPGRLYFEAIALNSIEHYFGGKVAISCVTISQMKEKGIEYYHTHNSGIANLLISVIGWDLGIMLIEKGEKEASVAFRTRDDDKYDVSKIALALGGGGHKAASGATIRLPLEEAKKLLLQKLKETYPELGNP